MQNRPYSVSNHRNILNRFREFEKHLLSADASLSAISDSPIVNNLQKYVVYLNTVCAMALPPQSSASIVDAAIAAPAATAAAAIAVVPVSLTVLELGNGDAAVLDVDPIGAFRAKVKELCDECDPKKWSVAAPDASVDTGAFLANVRICRFIKPAPLCGCRCVSPLS